MDISAAILRYRNGIVAVLLLIAVTMYLLPSAYVMARNFETGTPIDDLIWQASDDVLWIQYWLWISGGVSVTAFFLYRAKTLNIRFVVWLACAIVWILVAINIQVFSILVALGWGPFATVIILLAYPPYFVFRRLAKNECAFSRTALEHLAAFGAYALPLLHIGFSCMLDKKFFGFFF